MTRLYSSDLGEDLFAMASTHVKTKYSALAAKLDYPKKQVNRIQWLLEERLDTIGYPLLALSIYIMGQLDRLVGMMNAKQEQYESNMDESGFKDVDEIKDCFGWKMVHEGQLEKLLERLRNQGHKTSVV
ncbi:hypothetical protein Daesc_007836 [Daldinia eschscholtzii]|uniref:Uncharacterized protein n=1 Tax=Daldinia eschscholtzii TaxID=292717 RepID=A0AAX6MFB9_9PEZI